MAINVEQQIAYWKEGAKEDLEVAEILTEKGKFQQAMFFAHLLLEKSIKALVVKATRDIPPHLHNLIRLVRLCNPSLDRQTEDFLALMNRYQIRGCYFNSREAPVTKEEAAKHLARSKEVYQWLMKQL